MEFWEWMNNNYTTWRDSTPGKRGTVTDFAGVLGVKQPILTKWMTRGGPIPNSKSIARLALIYPEIYDVLGLTRPAGQQSPWDKIPPELRPGMESAITEILSTINARGVLPNSPEAAEIIKSVFSRYPNLTTTTRPG